MRELRHAVALAARGCVVKIPDRMLRSIAQSMAVEGHTMDPEAIARGVAEADTSPAASAATCDERVHGFEPFRTERCVYDPADVPPGYYCTHAKCLPAFDEAAAKGLDEYEVRRRWPRFSGACPDCGCSVIAYASTMHYIAGDW